MSDSSRSSRCAIVAFLFTSILLVFNSGCEQRSASDSGTREAPPERTESAFVTRLIIKDRFPTYQHVIDPGIDRLAFEVDTLYRQHRSTVLAGLSTRTLDLLHDRSLKSDMKSKMALGIALMKVNGAVTLERGLGASTSYLSLITEAWDQHWPPADSMGLELVVLKANALKAQGEFEHSLRSNAEAAKRARALEYWGHLGTIWRAQAYTHLEMGAKDSARILFRNTIALHSAPKTLDTSAWAGALLASIAADGDSVVRKLEQARILLPGVHDPAVIGFYYSRRGQFLAESERTGAGATCFKQAILAIDTLPVKTAAQAQLLALYLHNAAYAHRNMGEMEQARNFGTQAVALNEVLMRADDPIVARDASDRLAGNLEVLPLTDTTDARYGVGPARQMSVLRLRRARRPIDSVLVAKTFSNIASQYFYWNEAGLDSVLKYSTLCLEWPCRAETIAALHLKAFALMHKGQHLASLAILQSAYSKLVGDPGFTWSDLERSTPSAKIHVVEFLGKFEEVLEILERLDPAIRAQRLLQRMSSKQAALIDSLFLIEGTDLSKLIKSRELMTARLMRSQWPVEPNKADQFRADQVFAWMDDEKAMAFRRDRFLMGQANGQGLRLALQERRESREALLAQGRPSTAPEVLRCARGVDSLEALLAVLPVSGELPTNTSDELARRLRISLRADQAVLEFRVTKNDVFIALLSKDSIRFDRFGRTPALNKAIARLTGTGAAIDSLAVLNREELIELQRLLPPEIKELGFHDLVIVPSRELSYIPFEALPVSGEIGQPMTTSLIDIANVRYALSASMLLDALTKEPLKGSEELFAFAPDYGIGAGQDGGGSARRSANILLDSTMRSSAAPLLHNRQEVEAIGSIADGQLFIGAGLSELDFQHALEKDGVLHLAMHAFSSSDPMRSGLVFDNVIGSTNTLRGSGGSVPHTDDGVFHGYELLTQKINTSLVVLSACETGYGTHQDGEGVRSLARSFMLAGARSAVSSLWKVDDLATKEIMVKFYEKLAEGTGKADALAEAKRWYRRTYPNEPPSKWAAFILIGDNEPVHLTKRSRSWPWIGGGALVAIVAAIAARRRRKRMAA